MLVRHSVHHAAERKDCYASFAPKPRKDDAGSGMHLHFSLWKKGNNIIGKKCKGSESAPGERTMSLSSKASMFVAGILHHLDASEFRQPCCHHKQLMFAS